MFHDQARGFLDERIKFPATARLIPCSLAQGIGLEVAEINRLFDVDTVMSAAGQTNSPVISLTRRVERIAPDRSRNRAAAGPAKDGGLDDDRGRRKAHYALRHRFGGALAGMHN